MTTPKRIALSLLFAILAAGCRTTTPVGACLETVGFRHRDYTDPLEHTQIIAGARTDNGEMEGYGCIASWDGHCPEQLEVIKLSPRLDAEKETSTPDRRVCPGWVDTYVPKRFDEEHTRLVRQSHPNVCCYRYRMRILECP